MRALQVTNHNSDRCIALHCCASPALASTPDRQITVAALTNSFVIREKAAVVKIVKSCEYEEMRKASLVVYNYRLTFFVYAIKPPSQYIFLILGLLGELSMLVRRAVMGKELRNISKVVQLSSPLISGAGWPGTRFKRKAVRPR